MPKLTLVHGSQAAYRHLGRVIPQEDFVARWRMYQAVRCSAQVEVDIEKDEEYIKKTN